jgi:hypothetical protein
VTPIAPSVSRGANAQTSITVWGDYTEGGSVDAAYAVHCYHRRPGSPATDAADNRAVPDDVWLDLEGANGSWMTA